MAGISQLAEKKFKILFGTGRKELIERKFYHNHLLQEFIFSLPEIKAMYIHDIPRLADRCKIFGVQIIGIETYFESKYPFTVKVFEEFTGTTYQHEWIYECLASLKKAGIEKDLIVYVSIPDEILNDIIQKFNLSA
jgi:hypothetical protein